MTPTKIEKIRNFMFVSIGCSLLRTEGFSCSLDVLCGGFRLSKIPVAIFDKNNFFFKL
jgi:hypothetical protein